MLPLTLAAAPQFACHPATAISPILQDMEVLLYGGPSVRQALLDRLHLAGLATVRTGKDIARVCVRFG